MEELIQKKRSVAVLVPYRWNKEKIEFFLQKRDRNAPVHPNVFSMFGGGIEGGEEPENALKREISEELEYTPKAKYFSRFETHRAVFHVFIEEVDTDFKSRVVVHEGEYGDFLTFEKIDCARDVSDIAQMVTRAMCEHIQK